MTTKRKGVYPHLELLRRPRLGPGRLRRGAPAARADLPDDRRPAGPPPARPDRDAGARGRPRGRRVLPDRPEALRRAVEGHRGAGLHRAGRLRRGPGHADRRASGSPTRRPSRRSATGSRRPTASKTKVVERLVAQHAGEPTLVIGQYLDQLDDLGERLDAPVIKGETTVKERERLFEAFRHGEITCSSSARSRTSRSTCPRPASRSRCRARSARARRRRSGSAGCCGRRPTAAPRGSTRSSRGTPSTRTSPPTGSASSPSRATPTGSSTPTTSSQGPATPGS